MSNGKHSSNGDRKYKIKATRNGPDKYSFVLEDNNGGAPNLVFNKDTDNMKKRDYYVLEFHLHNEPGCDLEFVDDPTVLSACSEQNAVNGCAPQGSTFLPIVFVDPTKKLQKKVVSVINTDLYVEKFCFGLSFVSTTTGKPAYFDPGGENQDRGEEPFMWSIALAGMISGALAAAGTATLVSSSFNPSSALIFAAGGAVLGLIVGFVLERS